MTFSTPADMDAEELRNFLKEQETKLQSLLPGRHSPVGACDHLSHHAGQVCQIADRYSGQGLPSSNVSTSGAGSVPVSSGSDSNNVSGPGSPFSLFGEEAPSTASSNDIDKVEQSWSKRRKVGGSNDESDKEDEYRSIFVPQEVNGEEGSPTLESLHNSGDLEEITVKVEENEYIGESSDQPGDLEEAEGSDGDDFWTYTAGQTRKYCRTKSQEPKVIKAGQARRNFAVSVSDADDRKIIMDFNAWEGEEQTRKGGMGKLRPKEIYHSLKEIIGEEADEDENANHTAAQIALMILSLGSTQAIVELKRLIEYMRCPTQAVLARPPVTVSDKEKDALLDDKARKDAKLKRMRELTQFVYKSTCEGTPLENFMARYSSTNLCRFMISIRDAWMAKYPGLSKKFVQKWVYRKLIRRAYPKIPHYKTSRTGKQVTSQFKDAVLKLEKKTKCGFRWLALREKFGIGIMALYFHSTLFSETARFSIDSPDTTKLEFSLLIDYLLQEGNLHGAWLSDLCSFIKAHIEQGADGMLRLPQLFLERWNGKQIMMCKERSAALLAMCETLEGRLKRPGNNVSEKAWLAVDHYTTYASWDGKVKKEAQ